MTAITLSDVDVRARLTAGVRMVASLLAAVWQAVVASVASVRGFGDLNDVLHVAGAGLVSVGAWMAWPPAGFLVGGVLLLLAGVLGVGERQ